MEKEWLYAVLAVILILVLLFVPAKIKDVYNIFMGIGTEQEPSELTKLRAECTKLVDNNEPIDRCALEVAEKTLEAKEDVIIAEKWLRIQIEKGSSDYLKECLEFAKTKLYQTFLKDYKSAIETYSLIVSKSNDESFNSQIINYVAELCVQTIQGLYSVKTSAEVKTNMPLIEPLLKDTISFYEKYKDALQDKQILGDPKSADGCKLNNYIWYALSSSEKKRACSTVARATLSTGCYYYSSPYYNCMSCNFYKQSTTDVCSGYGDEESCKADVCEKDDCVWGANRCTNRLKVSSPQTVS